jgi:hypothetical protein
MTLSRDNYDALNEQLIGSGYIGKYVDLKMNCAHYYPF